MYKALTKLYNRKMTKGLRLPLAGQAQTAAAANRARLRYYDTNGARLRF